MGKSSPSPPDPFKTAQAQAGANKEAIETSAKVSAVDTSAPWGSSTFTRDSAGVPTKQTLSLGPAEQQFYDQSNTIKNSLAGKAGGFLDFLPSGQFTGPDNGAGDAVSKALFARKMGMVQPELDRADNAMKVQLSERGIPIGSEIYNNENDRLAKARGDTMAAISQDSVLAGGQEYDRQLANALTMRNQPFNEISAFLQGAPAMPSPQFQSTPAYNVGAPDIAGLINSDYDRRLAASNAANSSLSAGLFGLGQAAIGLSDRRAKTDIKRVGKTDGGLPVYTFRYRDSGLVQMGVMADEVEAVIPAAVHEFGGLKHVDYSQIT